MMYFRKKVPRARGIGISKALFTLSRYIPTTVSESFITSLVGIKRKGKILIRNRVSLHRCGIVYSIDYYINENSTSNEIFHIIRTTNCYFYCTIIWMEWRCSAFSEQSINGTKRWLSSREKREIIFHRRL